MHGHTSADDTINETEEEEKVTPRKRGVTFRRRHIATKSSTLFKTDDIQGNPVHIIGMNITSIYGGLLNDKWK